MRKQHFLVWTGGRPDGAAGCKGMADRIPFLPAPLPLRRAAHIRYQWGVTPFDIFATACSLRTTPWGDGQVTWLDCKAMQTSAIKPDEEVILMRVLIPAGYVTAIAAGPTFHIALSRTSDRIGLFPPIKPAPAGALPLSAVESALADLLAPERN